MNKLIIFPILFLMFFSSCKESLRNDNLEKKEIEIKEITKSDEVKKIEPTPKNRSIETFLDIQTLYPGKLAVEKRDANLDQDESIEQFIILIDELNLVTVVVADFNKITREYFIAWDMRLPFVYNSDFNMSEQDILAYKHNMELVIQGTTIANKNALYIFRKSAPPKGIHIYYKTIFSYETSGTIELVTPNRSLDYNENKKDSDKAYDVSVEKGDIIDDNTIAITKENWAWDKRINKYIRDSIETSEQKINAKEKLRNVYYGNKKNFLNFIGGEWLCEGESQDEDKIIIIDPNSQTFTLKYKDGVEENQISVYWNSFKNLSIKLINNDVTTIPYYFKITLDSTNTFSIIPPAENLKNKTSTIWEGNYIRLNNDIKKNLIENTNSEIKENIPFTGIYKNVAYSINFSYPEFTKTDAITGNVEEGIFSLLKIDESLLVLQLKTKYEGRSRYNVTNYKLTYNEQKLESQAIRTITIHEGVLTTHGIDVKSDASPLKFEQTEVISNES